MAIVKREKPGKLARVSWKDRVEKHIQRSQASTQGVSDLTVISFKRGGQLYVDGNRMKGDEVSVVILDHSPLYQYYATGYDPDEKVPPHCYAVGKYEDDEEGVPALTAMVPAENALGYWDAEQGAYVKPDSCEECPMHQWGSAETGKGKRCSERHRIICVSANDAGDARSLKAAKLATFIPSVMNVRPFRSYISQSESRGLLCVTTVHAQDDEKSQYRLSFSEASLLDQSDDDLMAALAAKWEQAQTAIEGFQYATAENVAPESRDKKEKGRGKGKQKPGPRVTPARSRF